MDGWVDGWMDGWIDGWKDGWMNVLYLDALWPLKGHLGSVFSSGSPQSLSFTQPPHLCLPSFLPTFYSPVLAPSWEVSTTFLWPRSSPGPGWGQ